MSLSKMLAGNDERLIIPKSEGNMLGSLLLAAISEYFADENHKQEFEAWQKNEKRRKEGGK